MVNKIFLKELESRIATVLKEWKNLPKAKSDTGEFVIIAEIDEGGSYEEYKECLGVKKDGTLIWSFLSGCSCWGENKENVVCDIDAKVFAIQDKLSVLEFYLKNKCEPHEADYCSY